MEYPPKASDKEEILLVHLGGLGDVCLSESVFLSLYRQYGDCLVALGNRRFLDLFVKYFRETRGVESRHWLYLFSDRLTGKSFRRIVFIGKDRQGSIRERWKAYSREKIIFVEMYPDTAFDTRSAAGYRGGAAEAGHTHIEDYQLEQLSSLGIEPVRKSIEENMSARVILYPEEGFRKEKWPVKEFAALFKAIKGLGMDVQFLRSAGLSVPLEDSLFIEDLSDVKKYFEKGGIFVSNDFGMAHLAGSCGLYTLTIFNEFDPLVWHPRGRNISLRTGIDDTGVGSITEMIKERCLTDGY